MVRISLKNTFLSFEAEGDEDDFSDSQLCPHHGSLLRSRSLDSVPTSNRGRPIRRDPAVDQRIRVLKRIFGPTSDAEADDSRTISGEDAKEHEGKQDDEQSWSSPALSSGSPTDAFPSGSPLRHAGKQTDEEQSRASSPLSSPPPISPPPDDAFPSSPPLSVSDPTLPRAGSSSRSSVASRDCSNIDCDEDDAGNARDEDWSSAHHSSVTSSTTTSNGPPEKSVRGVRPIRPWLRKVSGKSGGGWGGLTHLDALHKMGQAYL